MSETLVHELWGNDGGYVGTVKVVPCSEKDMAVVQVSMTVCGFARFDQHWHMAYNIARKLVDEGAATQGGEGV
jgi:hypothetical protein